MLDNEKLSELFPIGAITLYSGVGVAQTLRYSDQMAVSFRQKPIRGRVTELSQKSLNRLNFLVQTTSVELNSMLTLTYLCPPATGKKAKRDLRLALQWLKRRCDNKLSYVWWAEFTKAGAIHFHILLSCVPVEGDKKDFALFWLNATDQGQGRYCHIKQKRELDVRESILSFNGHEKVWEEVKKKDGAKRYCAKYATKPYQKQVPIWFADMGRFWGASRDVKKNKLPYKVIELTEPELREILTSNGRRVGGWDVLPRYLWGVSGEWFGGLGEIVMSKNT